MEWLKNELKDERNVNSFKSTLTLSWTGDCCEEDDVECFELYTLLGVCKVILVYFTLG